MPRSLITNIELAVGAGGNFDLQPGVGIEWLLTDFCSDAVFVTGVPEVQVSFYDGATECIILLDPTTDPGIRTRQYKIYLTNAVYARLTNTAGAGINVGYFGEIVQPGLTRSAVEVIGATAYITIQPPVGETWEITEWGMDVQVAVELNPDCEVGLTNIAGLLVLSRFIESLNTHGQERQKSIFIDNVTFLNVYSVPGGNFAYCARRVPQTCISSVQDVPGSGTLDIIPPAGDQWVITDIGAETWTPFAPAVAPLEYPDIEVSLRTPAPAAGNADLLEAGSFAAPSLRWDTPMQLKIDNTHFLRITEVSTANNEVCVSGYLERSY